MEVILIVAIMGVLTAIAVPNFQMYVNRSRQSEAKVNLSGLYAAEMTFASAYRRYTSRFDVLGFELAGSLYFNIGFDNDFAPPPSAAPGTDTCIQTCPVTNCPNSRWLCRPESNVGLDGSQTAVINATAFRAGAHTHLNPAQTQNYSWTIDQGKFLTEIIPAN